MQCEDYDSRLSYGFLLQMVAKLNLSSWLWVEIFSQQIFTIVSCIFWMNLLERHLAVSSSVS